MRKRAEPRLTIEFRAVLVVLLVICGCSGHQPEIYTITVEYLSIGHEGESAQLDSEVSNDYSSATVTINRIDKNESNEDVYSELTKSSLENGKIVFRGQSEQPMWLDLHVKSTEASESLNARTYVDPGASVSLTVVDYQHRHRRDKIAHLGSLTIGQESERRVTLSGDLSSSNADLRNAIATLAIATWNKWGDFRTQPFGHVALQNGTFSFALEIEQPVIMEVWVEGSDSYSAWTTVIADPGAKFVLQPSRRTSHASASLNTGWFQESQEESQRAQGQKLAVIEATERHTRLWDSWNRSYTYQLKQEQLDDAWDEHLEMRNNLEALNSGLGNTGNLQGTENTTRSSDPSRLGSEPAVGCEHVDLSQVRPDRGSRLLSIGSRYEQLHEDLESIRANTLHEIATRTQDPFDSLIALELALEWGGANSRPYRLQWLKVAENLSGNVPQVIEEARVRPAREFLTAIFESEENEPHTLPGQKAPNFELPNLDGTPLSLHQIVREHRLVYMEFVKRPSAYQYFEIGQERLFQSYGDAGLQTVLVMFGGDRDSWRQLNANRDDEWIQLFDPHSYVRSDVATSFATVHDQKNYLVDTKGCIIQKNLDFAVLQDFLSSYFGFPLSTE